MPPLARMILTLGLVGLLSACQLQLPGKGPGSDPETVTANAVTGDPIEVTALDTPPEATETALPPGSDATAKTQTDPPAVTPAETEIAEIEPAPVPEAEAEAAELQKSDMQIACEKKKGRWARTGSGDLHTCVFTTKDAGKSCTRQSQCEGLCLARSGTCSPIRPLLGCNDILQDDGSRVTLCID